MLNFDKLLNIFAKSLKAIEIIVKDTGLGIKKENLNKVFDRFFQVKPNNSSRMTGSGIGLAFSKKIVELHHGNIAVTSKENVGTEFLIKIPMDIKLHKEDSYEDFIEGIKPNEPKDGDTFLKYEIQEGVFKKICRLADDSLNAVAVDTESLVSLSKEEYEKAAIIKNKIDKINNKLDQIDNQKRGDI